MFLKLISHADSAANKYYSSAGHHEQKNKKTTGQSKNKITKLFLTTIININVNKY